MVRLSICVAPTDRFMWNWYWGLLWNLREIPNFVVDGYFTWTRKYVLLFPATLHRHDSDIFELYGIRLFDSRGGINITRTCRIVALYLNCLSCFIQLLNYNPSSCSDSELSTVPNHVKHEINVTTTLRMSRNWLVVWNKNHFLNLHSNERRGCFIFSFLMLAALQTLDLLKLQVCLVI